MQKKERKATSPKRELGLPMYDAFNTVEELKHPTAEKVEAIKDALKYFNVVER